MFVGDIFDPFAKVRDYLKVKKEYVYTVNWIYLLHSKWSFVWSLISLLFIFSIPVMIDEQTIECHGPSTDEVPRDFLNDWCWLSGTYIIPQHIGKRPGIEVVASGVGPDVPGITERLYHTQYIFYPIIFLFQFVTFTASKYLWKHLEGGRLKHLLSELIAAIISDETLKKRINLVTDYMTTSPVVFHKKYAYRFIFCEVYNIFNVVLQFWAIDKILHNEFLGYGCNAIIYLSSLRRAGSRSTVMNPFTKLFPKLALCHFSKFGASGNIVPHEAICVLPLNNIADKMFLVWWFWLAFLGMITTLGLIYRFLLLLFPRVRLCVLRIKTRRFGCSDLKYFVEHSTYGDWFVLSLMHKNLDSWTFSVLLGELVEKMKETREKQL